MMSAPIPVRWAGWKTTTYDLQESGWELSAREEHLTSSPDPGVTLCLHHPDMRIDGMTHRMEFDRYRFRRHDMHSYIRQVCSIGFDMAWVSQQGHYSMAMHGGFGAGLGSAKSFFAIDATPQIVEVQDIHEIALFAPAIGSAKEVVVMPDDVPVLMDRILELQAPAEHARYARMVLEERARPRRANHVQVVTLT